MNTETYAVEKAERKDLPRILEIYAYARNFMKETGNPDQWKDNFPPETLLAEDIEKGNLYVIKGADGIHAVFFFVIGPDPTYVEIEQGEWLSDTEYGTIHRVAGDGTLHGVLEMIVEFCSRKIAHLRIDTHEDNKVMQRAICKNGFQKCGIIHIADGSPRIAYEKVETREMEIQAIPGDFSVCKVPDYSKVNLDSEYCFIGKTDEEKSLVCLTEDMPENADEHEDGWKAFRIRGVLDFSLIGILARISSILAEEKIGIFVVSTFNTDYVLVKSEYEERALKRLAKEGYVITRG